MYYFFLFGILLLFCFIFIYILFDSNNLHKLNLINENILKEQEKQINILIEKTSNANIENINIKLDNFEKTLIEYNNLLNKKIDEYDKKIDLIIKETKTNIDNLMEEFRDDFAVSFVGLEEKINKNSIRIKDLENKMDLTNSNIIYMEERITKLENKK